MVRIPTKRQPTHPGEMLLEEFLAEPANPLGFVQSATNRKRLPERHLRLPSIPQDGLKRQSLADQLAAGGRRPWRGHLK